MPRTKDSRALGAALWLSLPLLARAGPADAPSIELPPPGAVVHTATPLVSGGAGAGGQVTVWIDGAPVGTAPAGGDGAWRYTPAAPLAAGAHSVNASVPDTGGGVRSSGTNDFMVVPGPPPAPVFLVPGEGAHVNRSPVFSGSAEAGTAVRLRLDGEAPRAAEVVFARCDAPLIQIAGTRLAEYAS